MVKRPTWMPNLRGWPCRPAGGRQLERLGRPDGERPVGADPAEAVLVQPPDLPAVDVDLPAAGAEAPDRPRQPARGIVDRADDAHIADAVHGPGRRRGGGGRRDDRHGGPLVARILGEHDRGAERRPGERGEHGEPADHRGLLDLTGSGVRPSPGRPRCVRPSARRTSRRERARVDGGRQDDREGALAGDGELARRAGAVQRDLAQRAVLAGHAPDDGARGLVEPIPAVETGDAAVAGAERAGVGDPVALGAPQAEAGGRRRRAGHRPRGRAPRVGARRAQPRAAPARAHRVAVGPPRLPAAAVQRRVSRGAEVVALASAAGEAQASRPRRCPRDSRAARRRTSRRGRPRGARCHARW